MSAQLSRYDILQTRFSRARLLHSFSFPPHTLQNEEENKSRQDNSSMDAAMAGCTAWREHGENVKENAIDMTRGKRVTREKKNIPYSSSERAIAREGGVERMRGLTDKNERDGIEDSSGSADEEKESEERSSAGWNMEKICRSRWDERE